MTAPAADLPAVTSPIRVPLWAWAVSLFALALLYLLLQENGAVLAQNAGFVHEFMHHGRHALGVPCH